MKKILLSAVLLFGSIGTAQADFMNNGVYYYECNAYSNFSPAANGYGYSAFSRTHACKIAMSLCVSATPVGYSCSF